MTITREDVKKSLEEDWGSYPSRLLALPPDEWEDFLQKQGYKRMADLLGHVIAWWQDGMRVIEEMLEDPTRTNPEYDVDSFNAQAIARFQDASELEVMEEFESTRLAFLALVERLPNSAFEDPRITGRLYPEIIGHLQEHQI